ncbi:preprotein translocase subunit SecG [Candidatus Falkowbacteria bacterium RIFOXYB2_FULL_38_15]|uniref:Protein-export membrane protein SecG n=1 Tax=Candidatus Falkowbacteria bacterium RIFOXYA2_FULL_38_12 TaxID=1797993 RepID=A0A1F5S4Q0_9BACT|nr:MAG: preprotein translocase subunit SecG [Candidatus Falkowbacteria bacterium RIFOXYA2_FULL_38_12]OGF32779.1 MAG: preprotein translocase subunit SecG [Candidatus Falkowbacteria bacterium RIFOXYB2_FULL_38_15]OGF42185.1 MAG: preprotein translocase subunit SecG [Candidatus Falkowbacteria bacterium RIFOXYD2_FULL_39_16]
MDILNIIQLVSAILLIIAILLQNRGASVGGIFGGEGAVFQTKRGLEKKLFIATIVFSIIFLGTALVSFIL